MKETELKLRIYGDKALRRKAACVKSVGKEEKLLLEEMAKTMYASAGVGLAAPQLGVNKQIIVLDVGKGLCKLINPKIKQKKDSCVMEEGCLSLPGVSVKVKRAKKIFVEAVDELNKKMAFWAEDLFARVIQHETDHLKGKLIVDYANILDKIKIRKAFKSRSKNKAK
ncbi:MAG: peptide deformylase [Candidatus Omnitrophica bacterium]|nr:peptide deformylase [Candidatus Omnitrophota bacterium]